MKIAHDEDQSVPTTGYTRICRYSVSAILWKITASRAQSTAHSLPLRPALLAVHLTDVDDLLIAYYYTAVKNLQTVWSGDSYFLCCGCTW